MFPKTRKVRHVIAAGGIAVLTAISLAACSGGGGSTDAGGGDSGECVPEHEFETVESGVLTLATYDYQPSTFIDGDGVTGYEGDLVTEFAERNCLTLNVTSAGGAGAVIPSIETGRADIGAGAWYRTDERAEIVRLSEPTVLDESGIVSTQGLTSNDLEGKRVGSVSGNLWNDSVQQWLGDDFSIYQDEESIYGDLAAGRIDAIIASSASAVTRMDANPIEGAEIINVEPNDNVPEFAKPGQINFPTTLDNVALGEALDAMILEKREDGSLTELVVGYGLEPSVTEIDEVWNL